MDKFWTNFGQILDKFWTNECFSCRLLGNCFQETFKLSSFHFFPFSAEKEGLEGNLYAEDREGGNLVNLQSLGDALAMYTSEKYTSEKYTFEKYTLENTLWQNTLWKNILWKNTLWNNTLWKNTLWKN